ncbi:LysR family transcriptional regulator [Aeromonas diversa]|uniref:LysR family transcriptional regulator n=1 Tax=Aeromonas diversa TaxID=502790 RepID=UPI0039A0FA4B
MDRLTQIRIFLRVAELGSFVRAAEQIGLPRSSVSQALQRLEAQLGVRLLHRTTRRVELTQDGQHYYERSLVLLGEFDELEQLFRPEQQLRGVLRIDMPTGMARHLVIPALPTFLERHPDLHLQLSSTDRRVDPVAEGFDAVIRVGPLEDSSLVARPLGWLPQINCASPDYLARHGVPSTLADLTGHRLIQFSARLAGKPAGFERAGGDPLPMAAALTVNSAEAYTAACLAGIGIIQAPEYGVRHWLASGELKAILPTHLPPPLPFAVLYAERRHMSRRLRAFLDWLHARVDEVGLSARP